MSIVPDALLTELMRAHDGVDADLPLAESERLRLVLEDRLKRAPLQMQPFPDPSDDRLLKVCEIVLTRLTDPPLIHELAQSIHLSDHLTAKLFRDEFQASYTDWRTRTKVFLALVDIAEGVEIKEVWSRRGWASQPAFIDHFSRFTGRTPGAFRVAALDLPTRRRIEPHG